MTPPPPRHRGAMHENPNLTFPLQLHCNQTKICFGTFGAGDFWRK